MSQDSKDFEQLRRLLALKRYEQPPPGYFHSFAGEIIVRIRAGELGEPESKWWAFDGSWLKWLWDACERRPVLAGGVSVAFCGFAAAATLISMNDIVDSTVVQTVPASNQYVSVQNGLATSVPASAAVTDVSYTDFPGLVHSAPDNHPASLFTGLWKQPSTEPASLNLIGTH